MDPRFRGYIGSTNGLRFQQVNNPAVPLYSNHDYWNGGVPILENGFDDYCSNNNFGVVDFVPFDPISSNLSSMSSVNTHENVAGEDYEFNDSVLRYINQILMDEDVEGKGCMLQESLEHQALEDAEKSLYEVIGKAYPSEHDSGTNLDFLDPNPSYVCPNIKYPDCYFPDVSYRSVSDREECSNLLADPRWAYGEIKFSGSEVMNNTLHSYQNPISSYQSVCGNGLRDGFVDCPVRTLQVPDLYNQNQLLSQFIRGVDDASKFLPSDGELVLQLDANGLAKESEESLEKSDKVCRESDGNGLKSGCQSRKHSFGDDAEIGEERGSKQAATSDDFDVRSDMFDKVLLYHARDENEHIASLRSTLLTAVSKKTEPNGHAKSSGATKGRGKKQGAREEVVDLRTLLTTCADAVAIDDRRSANDLLKRIRQHSSALGDGTQRLAHYMADGLEARLAGTGSEIYKGLTSRRTSASDVLKAYLLYLAACPFRKLSNFFSNKNIAQRTERAPKIHIIDFGILYGFQWPSFIQRQSIRQGGPPKIKITGIDFPQPGFRPAERVEETGLRLENYAQEFKVPFEYRAIAKRWDTIQLEDFDIDEDEVLIVNCMFRMKNLPDETMSVESPRNNVLKLIRKLNPDFFIHGVVNGSYNAPFFVTRFREALFHFSAQFDMLETIVPRDYGERVLIERDLLAREALNVIACEGWERVERPETYKQWQIRTVRAGFTQLPLDLEIKDRTTMQVRNSYHKDFVIDEDHRWLLLGWKGRIIFALATWKPI
ncbi:hypothetical protein RND81_13G079900 [Saponaria officinalis]|uniref:Scarecrow-like protein 9 n=1 Tax=Saponaria officinalis TaxID=3572 RepID=A0AAW1GYU5_SAPOF